VGIILLFGSNVNAAICQVTVITAISLTEGVLSVIKDITPSNTRGYGSIFCYRIRILGVSDGLLFSWAQT
jgi:hypothetical protein